MLVDGKWQGKWEPIQNKDKEGRFIRQSDGFREQKIVPVAGRYHLYVALICPWATRTLITRKLKHLDNVVGVTVLEPFPTDEGWQFTKANNPYAGAEVDPLYGFTHLHQFYTKTDPHYTGRVTVPVLWDKVEHRIINNESAEIIRLLNTGFGELALGDDLYPLPAQAEIDLVNEGMYESLNNGVYKAGFASSQEAYTEAVAGVFAALNRFEDRLSDGREYLVGQRLTESDIRLFVTLIRFDAAYYGLFKCSLKQIADYPNLQRYMQRLYTLPAFASTTNITHIKAGYYGIQALNPKGIVPTGPTMGWL